MSPTRVTACALLLAMGCSRTPPNAAVSPFRAPPLPRSAAPQQTEFRGYRLATSFVDKGPFRDGAPLRRGAIVGGLRVRPDASGLGCAETIAEPALEGGMQLPEAQGGGLLFWNRHALYTADKQRLATRRFVVRGANSARKGRAARAGERAAACPARCARGFTLAARFAAT